MHKSFINFFILAFVFLFFSSFSVFAASSLDLKVYPPTSYLSVKPGAGITHEVKLKNEGLYTLEITPALVDFQTDQQSGQVVLQEKSSFTYLNLDGDPNKWDRSYIIKPGDETSLNFIIAIPSDAEFAEHHLSILFQARQLSYASSSANHTLISAVVASNVVLLISGDEQNRGELRVDHFEVPKIADSFVGFGFSAIASNPGINATPIKGQIRISHWPDQSAETYELYPDMVLANDKRQIRAMTQEELEELQALEKNKDMLEASGEDFEKLKADFIKKNLRSKFFYKKAFLIGAYDLEIQVGEDIVTRRVVVLPFSALIIALLLPPLYWLANLLSKSLKK